MFVRNAWCDQLNSECHHNDNDITMIIAGLWRYDDWRHLATGCNSHSF